MSLSQLSVLFIAQFPLAAMIGKWVGVRHGLRRARSTRLDSVLHSAAPIFATQRDAVSIL